MKKAPSNMHAARFHEADPSSDRTESVAPAILDESWSVDRWLPRHLTGGAR